MSRSIQYTASPLLTSRTPVWRSKFIVGALALGFVGLGKEKFDLPAKKLNVVELRRIQLAKALATNPKLLLLDELLTGLTPKESDEAIEIIKQINKQGVTVLIVEHVMQGSLTGTDHWFQNPNAQVSAHFGIGKDGSVHQYVDTAFMGYLVDAERSARGLADPEIQAILSDPMVSQAITDLVSVIQSFGVKIGN